MHRVRPSGPPTGERRLRGPIGWQRGRRRVGTLRRDGGWLGGQRRTKGGTFSGFLGQLLFLDVTRVNENDINEND